MGLSGWCPIWIHTGMPPDLADVRGFGTLWSCVGWTLQKDSHWLHWSLDLGLLEETLAEEWLRLRRYIYILLGKRVNRGECDVSLELLKSAKVRTTVLADILGKWTGDLQSWKQELFNITSQSDQTAACPPCVDVGREENIGYPHGWYYHGLTGTRNLALIDRPNILGAGW